MTALLLCCAESAAQPRVEKNVVFGMYSGLALLMDVHYPATPNGRAVVFVQGSAFSRPLGYDAPQIKDSPVAEQFAKRLTAAGYTMFALNHRATPRFQYPGPVEDVQRAVRFIRAHAARFGIDPSRVGATGGSSGGYMVSMLGTLDGAGDPGDSDPVNRQSAKVQVVAAPVRGHSGHSLGSGVGGQRPGTRSVAVRNPHVPVRAGTGAVEDATIARPRDAGDSFEPPARPDQRRRVVVVDGIMGRQSSPDALKKATGSPQRTSRDGEDDLLISASRR